MIPKYICVMYINDAKRDEEESIYIIYYLYLKCHIDYKCDFVMEFCTVSVRMHVIMILRTIRKLTRGWEP